MRLALPAAALLWATGCAGALAHLKVSNTLHSELGALELRSSGADPAEAARVGHALLRASPHAGRWGRFDQPVRVWLLADHAALERAVRRPGYDWLRAWGRYDEILLQSPGTWPGGGAADEDLQELLVHELTHCLMYQRAAGPEDWVQRRIPLWFREGMASWTARQGWRWPTLEDLAHEFNAAPARAVFQDAEALSKTHERLVYGAAHHAFAFLVRRYGDGAVDQVLAQMRGGLPFEPAFEQALGLSARAFTEDFSRFVRWRAWRRDAPVKSAPEAETGAAGR